MKQAPAEKPPLTVWSTKYALTKGVERLDGCDVFEVSGHIYARRGLDIFRRIGIDCFLTEAEAKAKCAAVARAKIKAIDKKRGKLLEIIVQMEMK